MWNFCVCKIGSKSLKRVQTQQLKIILSLSVLLFEDPTFLVLSTKLKLPVKFVPNYLEWHVNDDK